MKTTLATTISGLLLVSAMGLASANPATPSPAPAPAQQDIFTTLAGVKVSLDDAIKTAEQTVSGKLVKAELDSDSKPNTYRVAIADNNSRTVTFMKIDSGTGKVLGSKVYHPDNRAANTASKAGATQAKTAPAAKPANVMKSTAGVSKGNSPASNPLKAPAVSAPITTKP